jgi:hypothetical protein
MVLGPLDQLRDAPGGREDLPDAAEFFLAPRE